MNVTDQTTPSLSGEPIAVAKANKKKIIATMAIRAALVALGYLSTESSFDGNPVFNLILFIVMATMILFPLLHIKDYMAFYPNAICFNGKSHPFSPQTHVTWRNFEGYALSTKQMIFNGNSINIAYLKDAKSLFYRSYGLVHTNDAT